jgi:DNA-binding CsgD family transcriptional regulator
VRPGAFAFCERASGTIRFQVAAAPDGELPVEEAASLLAMHCLVRAQTPNDYTVLVVPRRELLDAVDGRAQQLLAAGRTAAGSSVGLSPRQREVLDHVLHDMSNKEIGARLHVTERTIKFHVSKLLAKFKAHDRLSLKREAAIGMLPTSSVPRETLFGFVVPADVAAVAEEKPPQGSTGSPQLLPRPVGLLDFRADRRETTRPAVPVSSRP